MTVDHLSRAGAASECGKCTRERLSVTRLGQIGGHLQPFGAFTDANATSISCLLPTNCVKLSLETRARVAISSVLVSRSHSHERREGGIEDALAGRDFICVLLRLLSRRPRRH